MGHGFADRRSERIAREAAAWRATMLDDHAPAEKAAFEAWLNADPAHRAAYAEAERLSLLATRLPRPARSTKRSASRSSLRPAFALGTAAILALGTLVWTSQQGSTAAHAAVANPGLATRAVRLSDGSTIVLDTGTALSIDFSSKARVVTLESGRARINVASDPDRPFSLAAGQAVVTAGAALFDASLGNGEARVWPLRGRLEVALDEHGARDREALTLSPGAAVRVTGRAVTRLPAATLDRQWPVARMSFDHSSLAAVVELANKVGAPPIRLADENIGSLRVSGVLDIRKTRPLARKLAAALDLRVEERTDTVFLTR